MSVSETLYCPAISTSQELERGRTQTVTLPVYRDGALVAPASGTYTLFKVDQSSDAASDGKLVDAGTITDLTGSLAHYIVTSTVLDTGLVLGEGYREEWALTFDGVVYRFERPTALIRKRLYPVISDLDLEARYRELRVFKTQDPYGGTWQPFIDEAWTIIKGKLLREGWLPYLIRTPQSIRDLHVHLTLHLIFMDFYSGLDGATKWLDLADRHENGFEEAWGQAEFGVDLDKDGAQDDSSKLSAARRPIYPNGGQPTQYFSRFGLKGSY
jgi:hypothetical protein